MTGSSLFTRIDTPLPGCVELRPRIHQDDRGRFVKVFQREAFLALGLAVDFAEEYYSVSRKGVIRGLHFQRPPMDHAKLVYCVAGQVQDAVVDLRAGSPTRGCHAWVELSAERGNMLYIPSGLAHGFCVLSESATLVYKVTSPHSPEHDAGIRWDSAGIPWAVDGPILSERDLRHPAFDDFLTPFIYSVTQ
ncbi:MAG: dTDP-4-dehydrorhamnose 3,5-epimerase [Pseudomonadota bacterium]